MFIKRNIILIAKKFMPHDEEQFALVCPIYFLVGVYTGRYLFAIRATAFKTSRNNKDAETMACMVHNKKSHLVY